MRKKEKTAFVCWHLSSVLKSLKSQGCKREASFQRYLKSHAALGWRFLRCLFFLWLCFKRGPQQIWVCCKFSICCLFYTDNVCHWGWWWLGLTLNFLWIKNQIERECNKIWIYLYFSCHACYFLWFVRCQILWDMWQVKQRKRCLIVPPDQF